METLIHYELILLYAIGYRPKDVIRYFKFARGTAYRQYRLYRVAGERIRRLIEHRNSVSPAGRSGTKNLGALKKKKGRPRGGTKAEWEILDDGTITATVKHPKKTS